MLKYLHLDCEMGGLELQHSLLTAYFLITDDKFNKLDELYLRVKSDDGNYFISADGMEINKIDIVQHNKIAISYKQARPILYGFLHQHGIGEKLIPIGQGIRFDLGFIWQYLISREMWETFVSYRYIDICSIYKFLQIFARKQPPFRALMNGEI